ncbi:hypothetical protein N9W66_11080 [Luminiphilus sp.]|nr:hypothetical protein [Luminiphilus sp.]
MNSIKVLCLQGLIFLVCLEVLSFVGSQLGVFLVNETPYFYRSQSQNSVSVHDARTEEKDWGAWRRIHSSAVQSSECFRVEINANEVGARDDSFLSNTDSDIILLGDSFAEGWGVSQDKTAQALIERYIKKRLLNFGSAGNFGPLQHLIIYEQLASKYLHEEVLVFFLPANDFTDNERSHWENAPLTSKMRYRPYFGRDGDALRPWYFPEAQPTDRFGYYDGKFSDTAESDGRGIFASHLKKILVNFTWLSNPLRSLSYILLHSEKSAQSYYLSASAEEEINIIAVYEKLSSLAAGRPLNIVVIPTEKDIRGLQGSSGELLQNLTWYAGLKRIAESSGGSFIDLLEYVPNDYASLFHDCDAHWSVEGNLWAAAEVAKQLMEGK